MRRSDLKAALGGMLGKFSGKKQGDGEGAKMIAELKGRLDGLLVDIYGTSNSHEYAPILAMLNEGASKGACAKQLSYGDVAWRCLDCEKDPTCIICKDCFEKGDHTGHRVQLKRNVGGCCDCGDPEAWDENHFCSDHKGVHNVNPEEVLAAMPEDIKKRAAEAFDSLAEELKRHCMKLENYKEASVVAGMSDSRYRETMTRCVKIIFEYMHQRIDECTAFLYLVDFALSKLFVDKDFKRNEAHVACCIRTFRPDESGQAEKALYEKEFEQRDDRADCCTCTAMDLCLQTNNLLDNDTRELVYDFFFKMFQSYRFKQNLTLSFASNYDKVINKTEESDHEISTIGVQVLTSAEMSMIIYSDHRLLDIILATFRRRVAALRVNQKDQDVYMQVFAILHDLKYMSRADLMPHCIASTNFIEGILEVVGEFHFIDTKTNKSQMVAYDQEGGFNGNLINLEVYIYKIVTPYLREVPTDNIEKNASILQTFHKIFEQLAQKYEELKVEGKGFYNLPIHRLYAYYLTRLLLGESMTNGGGSSGQSLSSVFRSVIGKYLPSSTSSSLVASSMTLDNFTASMRHFLLHEVKHQSFVNEISARKWIYLGEQLNHYPHIYHNATEDFMLQDLCAMQIAICFTSEDQKDGKLPVDQLLDSLGLDRQLQTLLTGLKQCAVTASIKSLPRFDNDKLRVELTLSLRLMIQLCLCELALLRQVYSRSQEKVEQKLQTTYASSKQAKVLWEHALSKEAVHLLLLNRQNSPIDAIKDQMMEILVKDGTLQDKLFEISEQSRGKGNQVTFKLKDEYFTWFDPFYFVQPDKQSQIQMMYDQHGLKDKMAEKGVNDIVGDYMLNYRYATGLNDLIVENLARSQVVLIVTPLLAAWIKKRQNPASVTEEDTEAKKKKTAQQMREREENLRKELLENLNGSAGAMRTALNTFMETIKAFGQSDESAMDDDNEADQPDEVFTDKLLQRLADQNMAYHCLKIVVLCLCAFKEKRLQADTSTVLRSAPSMTHADKQRFLRGILKPRWNLLPLLLELFKDTRSDNEDVSKREPKLNQLIKFVLEGLYELDKEGLSVIRDTLDGAGASLKAEAEDASAAEKPKKAKSAGDMMAKMKKKQSKLMAKMKQQGAAVLAKVAAGHETEAGKMDAEDEAHVENCAFCQEELRQDTFFEQPFGNFAYVAPNTLLYHATQQTLHSQRRALKNADLAAVTADDTEAEKFDFVELRNGQGSPVDSDGDSHMNENDEIEDQIETGKKTKYTLKKLPLVGLLGNNRGTLLMNERNGAAAAIKTCKHYAHATCLQKYHEQQQTQGEAQFARRVAGFDSGEFSCPICKTLANALVPQHSLNKFVESIRADGANGEECKAEDQDADSLIISSKVKAFLDFYVDFFSQVVLKQQGILSKDDPGAAVGEVMLRDFKERPSRIIEQVQANIIHQINLIDVCGTGQFAKDQLANKLGLMLASLTSIVEIARKGDHLVLKGESKEHQDGALQGLFEEYFGGLSGAFGLDQNGKGILHTNLVNWCIKALLCSAMLETAIGTDNKAFNQVVFFIVRCFGRLLRLQFALAVQLRRNHGHLRQFSGKLQEVVSAEALDAIEQSKDEDIKELRFDVALPALRKIFAFCSVLGAMRGDPLVNHQSVANCTDDEQELTALLKELQLDKDSAVTLTQDGDAFDSFKEGTARWNFYSLLHVNSQSGAALHMQLVKFGQYLETNNMEMPVNLLLLTRYYEFKLFELPSSFMDLQRHYYKKPCSYCKKEVLDHATCLLCGETMCWFKLRSRDKELSQCKVDCPEAPQKEEEGLLTWHARVCEGGSALFLHTSSGRIFGVNNGAPGIFDPPYRNRYGEYVSEHDKNYADYQIDEQGGGRDAMKDMAQTVRNFGVGNAIVQQRTDPDTRHKVYVKYIL